MCGQLHVAGMMRVAQHSKLHAGIAKEKEVDDWAVGTPSIWSDEEDMLEVGILHASLDFTLQAGSTKEKDVDDWAVNTPSIWSEGEEVLEVGKLHASLDSIARDLCVAGFEYADRAQQFPLVSRNPRSAEQALYMAGAAAIGDDLRRVANHARNERRRAQLQRRSASDGTSQPLWMQGDELAQHQSTASTATRDRALRRKQSKRCRLLASSTLQDSAA